VSLTQSLVSNTQYKTSKCLALCISAQKYSSAKNSKISHKAPNEIAKLTENNAITIGGP
jgi:hypothetical protein